MNWEIKGYNAYKVFEKMCQWKLKGCKPSHFFCYSKFSVLLSHTSFQNWFEVLLGFRSGGRLLPAQLWPEARNGLFIAEPSCLLKSILFVILIIEMSFSFVLCSTSLCTLYINEFLLQLIGIFWLIEKEGKLDL